MNYLNPYQHVLTITNHKTRSFAY